MVEQDKTEIKDETQASCLAGRFARSTDLSFLNSNYQIPYLGISQKKKGVIGRLLSRLVVRLRELILGSYVQRENEYRAHLVRFLNSLTSQLDRRFWEDLRDEQASSIFALEKRNQGQMGAIASRLEQEVSELRVQAAQTHSELVTLQSVTKGLERLVALFGKPANSFHSQEGSQANLDPSYVLLENRYRGSEEEISSRLEIYPTYFAGAAQPVLEIGAGRGELQALMRKQGILSYGVDLDETMVSLCREQNFDVRLENGIEHLSKLPDNSLGGVIAIQVVEHLPYRVLRELLRLTRAKVVTGGKVIFETINSESLLALTQNYFRDPTHVAPLHPESLSFCMEMEGWKVTEVKKLSPYPQEAMLQLIDENHFYVPSMQRAVKQINHNILLLNRILYGYQDYCVVGEKVDD